MSKDKQTTIDEGMIRVGADDDDEREMTLAIVEDVKARALERVNARSAVLDALAKAAVLRTNPEDWTVDKRGDSETATLTAAGAMRIAPLYGIEVFNLRGPNGNPVGEPAIVIEEDGSKSAVMIADAVCRAFDLSIQGVRMARNQAEQFSGRPRSGKGFVSIAVSDQDLKTACYTGLIAKCVRTLTGTGRVPLRDLEAKGLDVSKVQRGHGYGKAETSATAVAGKITQAQGKMMYAKYHAAAKRTGQDWKTVRDSVLQEFKITSDSDLSLGDVDAFAKSIDDWTPDR